MDSSWRGPLKAAGRATNHVPCSFHSGLPTETNSNQVGRPLACASSSLTCAALEHLLKMGACFSDQNAEKYKIGGENVTASGKLNPQNSAALAEAAAQATALLTGSLAYSSWVELHVSCKHLYQADLLSKSDPMCVLFEKLSDGSWKEVGRTDVVANNHNPTFIKSFKVLYNFEKVQELRVQVVDISGQDGATVKISSTQALGHLDFKLSEAVTSKGKIFTRPLTKAGAASDKKPEITLTIEEMSNARELLTFTIAAQNLKNKDTFSKSDPFLKIERQQPEGAANAGSWLPVYKTEVIQDNLNPVFQPVAIKGVHLNNGDPYRPLRFTVYDFEITGNHERIGQVETSAAKFKEISDNGTSLTLVDPKQPSSNVGTIQIRNFNVSVAPTFLDYIMGGVEISFIVAVDFTASNGDPRNTDSLHYCRPDGSLTPYEEAIYGIGRVIEFYDSDKLFPAFGFGGARQGGPVSHCFNLNDTPNPQCAGVAGINAAYRNALSVFKLSGPTLFAPIIKEASRLAAEPTPHLRYSCLLILTDGAIMDMDETIDAIITASSLPMSILIVGVGNGDFGAMNTLDADKKRLSRGGRTAERDIVQFVEFGKYKNKGEALASELLAELPGQFLAYTKVRNIMPPAPPSAPPMH